MGKTKKTCVFDMDGVIAETHYALENKIKQKYPKFSLNNVHTYNFNKELGKEYIDLLQVPTEEIFKEFRNKEIFEEAKIAPYFIDFIENNKDKYNFVIHSLAFSDKVAQSKKIWLQKQLGSKLNYFSNIIIVIGNNKPALDNVDYIFEDSLKQLQKYNENYPNTKLILYDMPFNQKDYNKEYENVLEKCIRIKSFKNLELN